MTRLISTNLARTGLCFGLVGFALSEGKNANEMRALTDKVDKTTKQTLAEIKELRSELESHKKLFLAENSNQQIDREEGLFIT